jgi:glycosyltransferase involved in cell wall biosynthesis
MNELTVVIPVYNEADNIKTAIERIEEQVVVPHEIAIVYDRDEDTTVPVVLEIKDNYQHAINLVKNKYGRGVLNAVKTGMEEAATEFVIVTMADLSDPPEVMNDMLAKAKEGADLVCASRYMKGGKQTGGPFLKGLLSRIAGISLHVLTRIPTHDISNSFKMYRKSMLDAIPIESKGGLVLKVLKGQDPLHILGADNQIRHYTYRAIWPEESVCVSKAKRQSITTSIYPRLFLPR